MNTKAFAGTTVNADDTVYTYFQTVFILTETNHGNYLMTNKKVEKNYHPIKKSS